MPSAWHWSRTWRAQAGCITRARTPLSPPQMTQSGRQLALPMAIAPRSNPAGAGTGLVGGVGFSGPPVGGVVTVVMGGVEVGVVVTGVVVGLAGLASLCDWIYYSNPQWAEYRASMFLRGAFSDFGHR